MKTFPAIAAVSMAISATVSSFAAAQGHLSPHSASDASLTLAMGPVSAPHLPGGNPNGPASSTSDDTSATPSHHKPHHKASTRGHKHSEHGLASPFHHLSASLQRLVAAMHASSLRRSLWHSYN